MAKRFVEIKKKSIVSAWCFIFYFLNMHTWLRNGHSRNSLLKREKKQNTKAAQFWHIKQLEPLHPT